MSFNLEEAQSCSEIPACRGPEVLPYIEQVETQLASTRLLLLTSNFFLPPSNLNLLPGNLVGQPADCAGQNNLQKRREPLKERNQGLHNPSCSTIQSRAQACTDLRCILYASNHASRSEIEVGVFRKRIFDRKRQRIFPAFQGTT
jgi:hypothetical protein